MARNHADGDDSFNFSGDTTSIIFPEERKNPPESSYDSAEEEEEEDEETSRNVEENRAFWKSQDDLLQVTLKRSSSMELKVRRETKNVLREMNLKEIQCGCRRPVAVSGCRNCVQREICSRLRNAGYNCLICKSKWKSSLDIPSGEHTYLEVVEESNNPKREVRVIIELIFRAEFEIVRASEEYNQLVKRLPEVFIGKSEKLRKLIKILCNAAKKSMEEKKMHLGPWRTYKYMQAKWLGNCERTTPTPFPAPLQVGFSERPSKDMVMHYSAVEVL